MQQTIDGYVIFYDSYQTFEAQIWCYKGKVVVGQIYFVKEGTEIPGNFNIGTLMKIHYSIKSFNDIVNILRYEKPVKIFLNPNTKAGTISTTTEEIGEEES